MAMYITEDKLYEEHEDDRFYVGYNGLNDCYIAERETGDICINGLDEDTAYAKCALLNLEDQA